MADPEQFNADQLAFWNGPGGRTWVARQEQRADGVRVLAAAYRKPVDGGADARGLSSRGL
jgi:hypothetical protein